MAKAYRYFDCAAQYNEFEATIHYLKEHEIKFAYEKGIGDTGAQYCLYVNKQYEAYLW